jgi:hypothetical protein
MVTAEKAFKEVRETVEKVKSQETRKFPEAASPGDAFRQGDIYVTLLDSVPKGVVLTKSPSSQLAIGDTQGSRHCIDNIGNCTVYTNNPGMLNGPIIQVNKPVTITHPEHGHVELGCGIYEVTYQRNLDSEEREIRARD